MPADLKVLNSKNYLDTCLFIKDKCVPHAPLCLTTGAVALSILCLIVPNPYSPIVFKVTIIAVMTFGSAKILCFITPYLSESLQNISKHIQAFSRELIAVLFLAAVYFVDLSKDNLKKCKNESDPLIIYVPGYLHNSSGAVKIKSRVENETGVSLKCINLNSYFSSIDDYTIELKDQIQKIQAQAGMKKIILVGHSMGGLVALNYALNNPDGIKSVEKVFTISSPSKGTVAAYIGVGECAKEMRPGSKLVNRLNLDSKNNPNCRITQIGLKHDLIVPLETAFLDGVPKANTKIIEEVGHADILTSDEMIDILIQEIKR